MIGGGECRSPVNVFSARASTPGCRLSELAARTKIQVWILEGIERNEYERLPEGLFIRGFLRAFAREVRLDPAAIVAEYVNALEPQPVVYKQRMTAVDQGDRDRGPTSRVWSALALAAASVVTLVFSANCRAAKSAGPAEARTDPIPPSERH
jgi:cytoskeleton protein RodZ